VIDQLIAGAVLLSLVALLYWRMARAASKPRTTPKIPRDRSKDSELQVGVWFRLF
jgi:hypothetical protein